MKLFNQVQINLLAGIVVVLAGWAFFFYWGIMEEINDEVDDSLEDYSELIIIRSLAGQELPSNDNGTNNQYFLREVSADYVASHAGIVYRDSMVYIKEKKETEPARILTTLFKDKEGQYHELSVYTPTIEKADLMQSVFYLLVALFASLLVVILLINIWVFRRSMKPFYTLLAWLDNYRLGTGGAELKNPTNTTEFQKLNEAVTRFASHSEEVFEQQKLFIGNASHEIQTPLAVCMNRLEMLLEDETLTETQLEGIVKTCQTLEYVNKLNKSLLLLSKIDNHQFVEEVEVDMNRLVTDYLEDYQEVYGYKNLKVEVRPEGVWKVKMNEVLATVLVTNLLKNAFVHTEEEGNVCVSFKSNGISFRNEASDGPLDAKHIFERFYQGHKKEGSTGLGLALVDAVCRHSHLKIRYAYEEGWQVFELSC